MLGLAAEEPLSAGKQRESDQRQLEEDAAEDEPAPGSPIAGNIGNVASNAAESRRKPQKEQAPKAMNPPQMASSAVLLNMYTDFQVALHLKGVLRGAGHKIRLLAAATSLPILYQDGPALMIPPAPCDFQVTP